MKKNKIILRVILIIILAILTVILFYQRQETSPNNNFEKEIEKETTINELSIEEQENIINYLKENISELSPEKEVLGGNFHVNSVDFLDSNNLILEYEDGHTALIAEVNFEYLENEEKVLIRDFNILKN